MFQNGDNTQKTLTKIRTLFAFSSYYIFFISFQNIFINAKHHLDYIFVTTDSVSVYPFYRFVSHGLNLKKNSRQK